MIYPDEFETDILLLTPQKKQITPESPAAKQILARQAFDVAVTTLIACSIFAGLLSILP